MQNDQRPVRPGTPARRPGPAPVRRPGPAPVRRGQPPRPAPGRPPQRPAAVGTGRYDVPRDLKWIVLALLGVLIIGIVLQAVWPNGWPVNTKRKDTVSRVSEIHGSGPLRLNELMSRNADTLLDGSGNASDWIEVMNVGGSPIDIAGYALSKNAKSTNTFVFPSHILQPGECVIVFADATVPKDNASEYHAPFKLSGEGGTLLLFNTSSVAIDSVNFPECTEGIAYARVNTTSWQKTVKATPGLSNTQESYNLLHSPVQDAAVEITEVVSSNTRYACASDGMYYDYAVLSNTSGGTVDLTGWYLSDDPERPSRYRFPEGTTIAAGERLVVYCVGGSSSLLTEPHAGFALSSEGETLVLSDSSGRVVDSVTFDLLGTDKAFLKNNDGTWAIGEPTV